MSVDTEVDLGEELQGHSPATVAYLSRYAPTRAFASPPHARRYRRPTDVTLLIVSGTFLVVMSFLADQTPGPFLAAYADMLESLPDFFQPVWNMFSDVLVLWVVWLVLLGAFRRQWAFLRDVLFGLVGVLALGLVIGRISTGVWPDLWGDLLHDSTPFDYPPIVLAAATAASSIAAPHLARPFRYAGRWIVLLGATASTALGLTSAGHALGALALGWAVGAAVHLAVGSPGGLPSLNRVRLGLEAMGIDAEPHDVEPRGGVAWVHATAADGSRLDVKVYGRDAWDGQLLVSLWRFMWYRDSGPALSLSRLQQVEHEAFVTLLADRRGAPVAHVIAAGIDNAGDALLVTQRFGSSLREVGTDVTDAQLASAWHALTRLHATGISHGAITLDRIRLAGEEARLSDFASAQMSPGDSDQLVDRAQLLIALAVAAGQDRAIAAAMAALGQQGLTSMVSFVQPAALPVRLRHDADAAAIDVDAVRKAVTEVSGSEPQDLTRLRRLSWGRVVVAVLLIIASYALISSIADVGLDTIIDAMREASVPLLILAFLIGLTPRLANAFALRAAAPIPIPLGRLTALQLAVAFINLAVPSTAARVATNVRFFQRNGIGAPEAVTIGALDGFVGFLAQITLIVTFLGFSLGSLDINILADIDTSTVLHLLLLFAIAIVVGVLVVLLVTRLRTAVFGAIRRVWGLLGPLLKSPRRLFTMFFANIVAELLWALCMYTTLHAFGQNVSYADMVLINEFVALFAGLMPVPGGIGVTEAALTAGFIAIGVPQDIAFAAAITQRVVTFYTQPIVGWFAFRWLQRQRYL